MTQQKTVAIAPFNSCEDLKVALAGEYKKQIENYFGDEKRALRFLSGVIASVQRTPKLLECDPTSVINSFMTMAQLQLMPSGISGEAYVIPYKNKGRLEAQFQLGYQGLVTLFYRAGTKQIVAELVYEKDEFDIVNGKITHKPDVWVDDKGEVKGAYVIVTLGTGGEVSKVMSMKEILDIGKKFSKSYGSEYSPWNEKNDPQRWMARKTVLKQIAKLVPKNDAITTAISEDNRDSIIGDREVPAKKLAETMRMGKLLKKPNAQTHDDNSQNEDESQSEGAENKEPVAESGNNEAISDADIGM